MTQDERRKAQHNAAVVFDDGVAIDLLLVTFSTQLLTERVRVGGLVRAPRTEPSCGPGAPRQLIDVATREPITLCTSIDGQCVPDLRGHAEARRRLKEAATQAELLFLPREERESRPLLPRGASHAPTITAVPRSGVAAWLADGSEHGTLLDARLWVLHDWWRDLTLAAHGRTVRATLHR